MAKCPNCGAEIKFSAKSKKVHCDYCDSDFDPKELRKEIKAAKENTNDELKGKAYSCTQCGATLLSFDETAVTFCSYCGSQNIIEEKTMKQTAPDVIIPFSITQDECIKNYKRKVNSFLFSPKYMKSEPVISKFRGIYMPYGIYYLTHKGNCSNNGKKYNHRSGDYVYYDDYRIDADVDASYNGISFDLLSKFYDEYSHTIPFDYHGVVDFNVNYLPGFYADSKDVDPSTYRNNAITLAQDDSTRFLNKKAIYRRKGCHSPRIHFNDCEYKIGFFPVYFAAIKSKDNEHIHYAIINGQTGKVAVDMPIDFTKYIIFSIILAIPIFFVINSILILPKYISIFASIMSLWAWLICGIQLSKSNDRENRLGDKGYKYINDIQNMGLEQKKRPKRVKKYKMKKGHWIIFLSAILIPLLVVAFNPVNDIHYYISSIISLILVLISFKDLIDIHNILVSRSIPQLEKRGGDESE